LKSSLTSDNPEKFGMAVQERNVGHGFVKEDGFTLSEVVPGIQADV